MAWHAASSTPSVQAILKKMGYSMPAFSRSADDTTACEAYNPRLYATHMEQRIPDPRTRHQLVDTTEPMLTEVI